MQISIIGDSASTTIGEDVNIYPRLLYNQIIKKKNCQIMNYSVPGMTSSDAKSLYFSEIKNLNNDILIIYLGNNESTYGYYKGYCNHLIWNIKKIFHKKKKYSEFFYLKNKFKFSYEFSSFSIINSNHDFKKNLESIIKHTTKKKIFTILINPIANKLFPSGAGLTNYEFFKLIDFDDKVSNLLSSSDEWSDLLLKAINYQENNLYNESIKIYENIIKNKKNILSLIAANNLAVIFAKKNPERSREIFLSSLNKINMYDPVIYYNLYLLEKTYNTNQAEKYLRLSYTKDLSLYRIQDEYRNSLKELHEEFNTNYLDLNNILFKNDFIDYCHPKEDGHAKIAKNIIELINKNYKISKDLPKKIYVNKLVSPDYFNDSSKNFIDYYLIEKNIDKNKIKNHLLYLLKNYNFYNFSGFDLITKYSNDKNRCYLIHFIKTNFIHPIFTETLLSKEAYLPLQSEIFNLPENFIYRVMFNYFIFFEKNISDKIIPKINLYLNSKLYEKIILRNNNFPLDLPLLLDKNYQKEIEKKMCLYISNQNILFENNICNRIKTTVFWYTRESFRYGTLSRNSMLYSRLSIDRLLETLIVLITIEFDNNGQKVELYTKMLLSLLSLIDIHESHVNKYLIQKNFDRTKYDKELSENKKNFLLLLEKLK